MPQTPPRRTFANPFHDDFRLRPNPHCYPPEYPDFPGTKGRAANQETLPLSIAPDGTLSAPRPFLPGTEQLLVNGVSYLPGSDYELIPSGDDPALAVALKFLPFPLDAHDSTLLLITTT